MSSRDPRHVQEPDAKHHCGLCGRQVSRFRCRRGQNAGKEYITCDNPAQHPKSWWRWFSVSEEEPSSSGQPAIAAAPSASSTPGRTCTDCSSNQVAVLCQRGKCRQHCLKAGGCALANHRQRSKKITVIDDEFDYTKNPRPSLTAAATSSHLHSPSPTPSSVSLSQEQRQFDLSLEALQSRSPPSRSLSDTAQTTFIRITWLADGALACVEGIQTESWPFWTWAENSKPYAFYSVRYRDWVTVAPRFVHTVTADEPLFIRCPPDVVGSDEARQLQRLPKPHHPVIPFNTTPRDLPSSSRAASSRNQPEILEERRKRRRVHDDDDDDDEVVVVAYRRAIKQEPVTPPRRSTRPSLAITIPDSPLSLPALSLGSSASSSSLPSPGSLSPSPDLPSPRSLVAASRQEHGWKF